jgi:hypothetical protein
MGNFIEKKDNFLDKVQSMITNPSVLTDIFIVVLLFFIGLWDFTELTFAPYRLYEIDFYSKIVFRFMLTVVVKSLYVKKGIILEKIKNSAFVAAITEIINERKKIEDTGRFEELADYANEEVDLLDTLDEYEFIITKRILKIDSKTWKSQKDLDERKQLITERFNLRKYRSALVSKDSNALAEASNNFDLSQIVIKDRRPVTADTLLDGSRSSDFEKTGITFDEGKEINDVNFKGSWKLLILVALSGIVLDSLLFSGDNWPAKFINLLFNFAIVFYSMAESLNNGKKIAQKELSSINIRLRYLKSFTARTKKVYKKTEQPSDEEPKPLSKNEIPQKSHVEPV